MVIFITTSQSTNKGLKFYSVSVRISINCVETITILVSKQMSFNSFKNKKTLTNYSITNHSYKDTF